MKKVLTLGKINFYLLFQSACTTFASAIHKVL